ncbi:DUF4129 domain-containing protein [Actinopolymorpha sp. NPDC004070]|uniref:DUF4129 domain-containing protein n=1 Tax=Actinopolymorpha sp. NPDC004070 TaxID=3154548 RepID=UPI0033BF7FE8
MRERGPAARWAGAAMVAMVLVLLAAGAVGLGWQDRVSLNSQQISARTIVGIFGVVLGLGLALFVAALILGPSLRRKDRPQRTSGASMAIGFLVMLVIVLGLFAFRDQIQDVLHGHGAKPTTPPTVPPVGAGAATPAPGSQQGARPSWNWPIAVAAGFVVGLVALALALVVRRQDPQVREAEAEPSAAEVHAVVAAGRAALADLDEPRAAVIGAYAAMEEALARTGVARAAADTPSGLLRRAVDSGLFSSAGAAAAEELTELFRQARYTRRELNPQVRIRAVEVLGRLENELRVAATRDEAARDEADR